MTTYFSECIAVISWPKPVVDELVEVFSPEIILSNHLLLEPGFGQILQVGDKLILSHDTDASILDRAYVKDAGEDLLRIFDYLSFMGFIEYTVNVRQFGDSLILFEIALMPVDDNPFTFSDDLRKAYATEGKIETT